MRNAFGWQNKELFHVQKSPVSKCRVKTQDHEPHLGPPNNFENCERPINLNVQSYWGKKTGGQKLILIGKKRNSWCYKPSICLSYPWLQLGRNSPCSSKAENKLSYRTPSASPVKTSPFHPRTLSSSLQIHPTSTPTYYYRCAPTPPAYNLLHISCLFSKSFHFSACGSDTY